MTNVTRIFMFSSDGLVSNTRFQRLEPGIGFAGATGKGAGCFNANRRLWR